MTNKFSGAMAAALIASVAGLGGGGVVVTHDDMRSLRSVGSQNGPMQGGEVLKGAVDRRTSRVRVGSGGVFGGSYYRRAGYGWTNRHQQRVALKARNVKRHRAACR